MSACNIQFKKVSDRVNRELYYNGYSILGQVDRDTLRQIKKETESLREEIDKWNSEGRLFALIDTYRSLFLRSNKIIEQYMCPFIREHFSEDEVEVNAASHFIKPMGKKGRFLCHQDSAVVEEPENFSINAWMPLTAVNRVNGCVWALPGSHIFPYYPRYAGFNPYSDDKVQKDLWSRLKPVPMKAGEILLFHRSLLHGSTPNYLPYKRMAIESLITAKGAQLVVNYKDAEVPDDKILTFPIDKQHFFENEDPRGKLLRERKNEKVKDFPGRDFAANLLPSYFKKFEERAAGINAAVL